MRPSLSLVTTSLSLDEKINMDKLLAQLPGVHHVEWGTRPVPHVNIVYEDQQYVDPSQAKRVLGDFGAMPMATA